MQKQDIKTFNQLKSWNLKFHKLIFGKPTFDIFIDDKSFGFKKIGKIKFESKMFKQYLEISKSIKLALPSKLIKQIYLMYFCLILAAVLEMLGLGAFLFS